MKRSLVVICILGLVFAGLLIWHMHSVRAEQERARDAGYAVLLKQYQSDLHTGMTGAEVQGYLESHHLQYEKTSWGDGPSYAIPIAEEPGDGFACGKWTVYAALIFTGPNGDPRPLPSSTLKEIKNHKFAYCV